MPDSVTKIDALLRSNGFTDGDMLIFQNDIIRA